MAPTVPEQLSPARRGWEGGIRLAGRFPVRTLRWGRSVVRPGSWRGRQRKTTLDVMRVYGGYACRDRGWAAESRAEHTHR